MLWQQQENITLPTITCPSCATSYELPDGALGENGRKVKCATCGDTWHAKATPVAVTDPVLDSVATGFIDNEDTSSVGGFDAQTTDETMPIDVDFEEVPSSSSDPIGQKVEQIGDGDVSLAMPPAVPQEMPRKKPVNPIMRSHQKVKRGTAKRSEEKANRRKKRNKVLQPLSFAATLLLLGGIFIMREPLVRVAPDLASYFESVGLPVNLRGFEVAKLRSERVIESGGPVLIVTGEVHNITDKIAQVPPLRLSLKTNTNEEIYVWTHTLAVRTIVSGGKTSFQSRLPDPPALGRKLDIRFTEG